MRQLGAEGPSFPTIIAAGKKSAYPHAVSTQERIRSGNVVLVDMGVRYSHYCADLTRTFFLDRMSPFLRRLYDKVLTANKIACSLIKPGVVIAELEKAVRSYFRAEKCEQYFAHSLGHGIGLEVHEMPSLSVKNTACLQKGMVFTIEPGLYVPGKGGVRIEDMVCVTADGYERLSQYPRAHEAMII